MITYEHVKLAAEVVAFIAVMGAIYSFMALRRVIRDTLGEGVFRALTLGSLLLLLGYGVNVLNDVVSSEFLKILDDVLVALGMGIVMVCSITTRRAIATHVKPHVVFDGTSTISPGPYLVRSMSVDSVLRLLSGKKILGVTRFPEVYLRCGASYIWLSNVGGSNAVSPTALAPLLHAVTTSVDRDTFVILDSVDYLVLHNGEDAVLRFVLHLKDILLTKGAGLVIIASPETLGEKMVTLLEREFRKLPM
ncbi:DUF835 domain-containing protein [Thermococcus indicus]|uniref:DUF835 domain-containing protein n=1 Tax=Thermococcus indicus TaxID=2586643 RepID=A0A4Y5SLH7_9EURY|nr:DUF835 domain-containing protein [Thermococcus indicus]QDA31777.1 DUF835 domain-containing protein [Thermococcus indicus]